IAALSLVASIINVFHDSTERAGEEIAQRSAVNAAVAEAVEFELPQELNFTDQFLCAGSPGERVIDPSEVNTTDWAFYPADKGFNVTSVSLDIEALKGHYADAVVFADGSEIRPIGYCLAEDSAGVTVAAPFFQAAPKL
ncbi:MAG: hypothetical protein AAF988_05460, partial [Pseudomonadota bacterium]